MLAIVAVLLAGAGVVANKFYRFYQAGKIQEQCEQPVYSILREMRKTDIEPEPRKDTGVMARNAAQELARLLPENPHFFGNLCGKFQERSRLDVPLSKVIKNLPAATDPLFLFEVTEVQTYSYEAALRFVADNSRTEYLIEKACDPVEAIRIFAARALRPSFPFGRLDEPGVSELAEAMSVEKKRNLYDRLFEEAQERLGQKLAGKFGMNIKTHWRVGPQAYLAFDRKTSQPCVIRIKGDWKEGGNLEKFMNEEGSNPFLKITIILPCVEVSREGREWNFRLFGKSQVAQAADLETLSVRTAVKDTEAVFRRLLSPFHYSKLASGEFSLTCREEGLRVTVEGIPRYQAAPKPTPGFGAFDIELVRLGQ